MFWFQPLLKQQCSQTIVDLIANLHLFQPLLKQQCSQTSVAALVATFQFQPLLKQQCSQTCSVLYSAGALFQPLLKQQCSQTSGEAIAQKFRSNHYSNSSALKPNQYNSLSPLRKTGT